MKYPLNVLCPRFKLDIQPKDGTKYNPLHDEANGCIASVLDMTQSAISHQLRILKQMKLVKFRREGKTVYYSLADSHVETILNQGLDHVLE